MPRSVFLVLVLAAIATAHPAIQKQLNDFIEENPCLVKCFDALDDRVPHVSITKTVKYANYLTNLDAICEDLDKARKCIDACGVESNPFELHSMQVMCKPEVRKEVRPFISCLQAEGNNVNSICENHCGKMDILTANIQKIHDDMKHDPKNLEKLHFYMKVTNEACGLTKCMARCSRDTLAFTCRDYTTQDAGEFLENVVDRANDAMIMDLEKMKLVEPMAASVPPQCNYMYTRNVLFNATSDEHSLQKLAKQVIINTSTHAPAHVSSDFQILQKAILDKEMDILKKQGRNLDLEYKKLRAELRKMNITV